MALVDVSTYCTCPRFAWSRDCGRAWGRSGCRPGGRSSGRNGGRSGEGRGCARRVGFCSSWGGCGGKWLMGRHSAWPRRRTLVGAIGGFGALQSTGLQQLLQCRGREARTGVGSEAHCFFALRRWGLRWHWRQNVHRRLWGPLPLRHFVGADRKLLRWRRGSAAWPIYRPQRSRSSGSQEARGIRRASCSTEGLP